MISIRDKNKCYDIFWNLKLGDQRIYQQRNIKYLVKYRINKQKLIQKLSQLNLLKYLKAFSGYGRTPYLEILLRVQDI